MLLNEIGNTYAMEQLGQFSDTGALRRRYGAGEHVAGDRQVLRRQWNPRQRRQDLRLNLTRRIRTGLTSAASSGAW
ncbi:hypothetical protein [Micromonospora noduli]|uniref:hypothetical protein n=1 Tax=Micromonospora noduli TaxID=709876 RepID=UPI0011BF053A|nr:hypothetical protein [Micromonospora noduli]